MKSYGEGKGRGFIRGSAGLSSQMLRQEGSGDDSERLREFAM